MVGKHHFKKTAGFKISYRKHIIVLVLCVPLLVLRLISLMRNFIFRYKKNKTVVIIEPFGMGDVITHEPLVRTLKNSGYSVVFCGRSMWRNAIPESESVCWHDIFVSWSAVSFSNKYRLFGFISSLFKTSMGLTKVGKGSIGIDARGDVRSILLLHLAGCRKVYTLSNYIGSSMRVPYCGSERIEQDLSKQRWKINMDFARALNIDISFVEPPKMDHLLQNCKDVANAEIAMIPFAAGVGKRWPVDYWQIIIAEIKRRGLKIRWLCGPKQSTELIELFGNKDKCTEINSIQQWVCELDKRQAVISVNTGPMHIAAALNKPLIVMCGSSTLPLWMPEGHNTTCIHHQNELNCIPCHQVDSNLTCGNECMKLVNPTEVINALFSVINVNTP